MGHWGSLCECVGMATDDEVWLEGGPGKAFVNMLDSYS